VKRKLGNYKDALRDLNRANDLSPNSSWILGYAILAHMLYFSLSRNVPMHYNMLLITKTSLHVLLT
jgi:hypothetical protein